MTDLFADLHVDARELTPAVGGKIGRILAADMAWAVLAVGADPDGGAVTFSLRRVFPIGNRPATDRYGCVEMLRKGDAFRLGAKQ